MDIPIARRGKIVSAVRLPPISKTFCGNPLTNPLNCSNAAKSTITAVTSMIVKTALNSMDRMLNSRCRALGSLTTMFLWCRSHFVTARTEIRDTPNCQTKEAANLRRPFVRHQIAPRRIRAIIITHNKTICSPSFLAISVSVVTCISTSPP
jgi:hypothetical protein